MVIDFYVQLGDLAASPSRAVAQGFITFSEETGNLELLKRILRQTLNLRKTTLNTYHLKIIGRASLKRGLYSCLGSFIADYPLVRWRYPDVIGIKAAKCSRTKLDSNPLLKEIIGSLQHLDFQKNLLHQLNVKLLVSQMSV